MYYSRKSTKLLRLSFTKWLISFSLKTGLIRVGRQAWAKSLTVLNYHRIEDPYKESLDSFQPNISAHPYEFKRQMDYLSRWFNVIPLSTLTHWLEGKTILPPFAALITFDDGYLDNYTNAYPILNQYGFPAVIFLTTGHIETNAPFYWDLAAYCFSGTRIDQIKFPDGKIHAWSTKSELDGVMKEWVKAMKLLPELEKQKWVSRLPELLDVSIPNNHFKSLMLNWDQIRELHNNGFEFGGHTVNHPILTRISRDMARIEIKKSKDKIEEELGCAASSFAYPNGLKDDVNSVIETITAECGFKTAFTLQNGPTTLRELRGNPYAIRRIFISHSHTLSQFATLLSPFNRLRPE